MSTTPMPQPNTSLLDSLARQYSFVPTGLSITAAFSAWDSHARLTRYIYPLQSVGGQMMKAYESGAIGDHMLVSHDMFKLRNNLMTLTRNAITPGALAMSEFLKESPPSEAGLRKKIADKLQRSPISPEVKSRLVSEELMRKAISPNVAVTAAAVRNRWLGVTGFAIFLPGQLTFKLYRAPTEDRIYEIFHTSGEVVGGTIAAWKAVPHLWGACKATIPKIGPRPVLVLHLIFNFGASTAGALAGGAAVNSATGYQSKI